MGPIIFFLTMVLALSYAFLIIYFSDGWDDTDEWSVPSKYQPDTSVAILIPVRNEGKNINLLIEDILANQFPPELLTIYVLDDHSTDNTAEILHAYFDKIIYISIPENCIGKKAALNYGVGVAEAKLIVCVDGDCRVPDKYLKSITSYFEYHSVDFTTGMVTTEYKIGFLEAMQYLDLAGTMLVGAAGIHRKNIFIANGANMAFRKNAFYKIGGFEGNLNVSSGDDMFLINKFASQDSARVKFLKCKDAIVTTQPEKSLADLLSQRKRWATKAKYFKNTLLIKLQIFVAIVQIWILACFLATPFTSGISFFSGLFLLFIKWIMDYLLVAKMCRFYENTRPLKYFIQGAILQFIVYGYASITTVVATNYVWKDRKTM